MTFAVVPCAVTTSFAMFFTIMHVKKLFSHLVQNLPGGTSIKVLRDQRDQGCQNVCFQKSILGIFSRILEWKMLVYYMAI
jgi:hypothetical protein